MQAVKLKKTFTTVPTQMESTKLKSRFFKIGAKTRGGRKFRQFLRYTLSTPVYSIVQLYLPWNSFLEILLLGEQIAASLLKDTDITQVKSDCAPRGS